MFFWRSFKMMNARQAMQHAKDASMEYFEIRFAIRAGDKNAAAMLEDYKRRYSAFVLNIRALQAYALEAGV